jgi:hypothetical protein
MSRWTRGWIRTRFSFAEMLALAEFGRLGLDGVAGEEQGLDAGVFILSNRDCGGAGIELRVEFGDRSEALLEEFPPRR